MSHSLKQLYETVSEHCAEDALEALHASASVLAEAGDEPDVEIVTRSMPAGAKLAQLFGKAGAKGLEAVPAGVAEQVECAARAFRELGGKHALDSYERVVFSSGAFSFGVVSECKKTACAGALAVDLHAFWDALYAHYKAALAAHEDAEESASEGSEVESDSDDSEGGDASEGMQKLFALLQKARKARRPSADDAAGDGASEGSALKIEEVPEGASAGEEEVADASEAGSDAGSAASEK